MVVVQDVSQPDVSQPMDVDPPTLSPPVLAEAPSPSANAELQLACVPSSIASSSRIPLVSPPPPPRLSSVSAPLRPTSVHNPG